ncbi:sperm flagellar protein 1-like [Saccostrea echinata]|uniref:sperm flagellar protein 1-like n=1 Tax=Saccostrea echinata TaxID=191078 RepID=UPI002A814BF1|nr:sperm flagellar protein 1-like [Saccostrea echinata]XP_061170569.1 sperm flagellar protein 1-like [Saccostrea echinata]
MADDAELEELYAWVDSIPLSRPKKNIARDFSDGVLVAEIIHNKFPTLVDLHNYSTANSTEKKLLNWKVLNRKVLSKLNFTLGDDVIGDIIMAKAGVIEKFLMMLRRKLERAEWELTKQPLQSTHRAKGGRRPENDKPEADQYIAAPGRGVEKKNQSPTRGGPDYYPDPPRRKPIGSNKLDEDNVPRILFEEKVQESLSKDETIEILQAKIKRMEHLLHLKDVRIDDLQSRVEKIRPTGSIVRR